MNYTTLLEKPEFFEETLKLIEGSFDYSQENSFLIDFNPLMRKENHENCHLLIKDEKVIGHIGVFKKKIKLKDKTFTISMYGGIAIAEEYRGQGLLTTFFNNVIAQYNEESCFHMLWSDQLEMYERFGFYPCIDQYEYDSSLEDAFEYTPYKLNSLGSEDISQLKFIYDSQPEIRFLRTLTDWEQLKEISSSDLYIKRDSNKKIQNYFFMNKGEDLSGVIIEVGDFNDFDEIINYGVLWSPHTFEEESESLYASMIKKGSIDRFIDFIQAYTEDIIQVISIKDDEVHFNFEGNNLVLDFSTFLTGVLGPNSFEELNHLSPFYISGLDSI
jgi:predicted N-acetyltransferase YhbS